MYKIGELSKLCQLPVKTLRYYDSIGLLVPDEIDRFTGYRYYSAARLADCHRIVALKALGFSLDEIRCHLNASVSDDVVAMLDAKEAELRDQIKSTKTQLRRLETVRKIITEGEHQMFNVIIRSSDSVRVAYVRQIFKTKNEAYSMAVKIAKALPKHIIGSRKLIINYETAYKDTDFDMAVCVEITASFPKGSSYEERMITLPGDIASLICKGDELDSAYRAMTKYIGEENLQVVGAFYEFYHDDGTVELKVPVYHPVGNLTSEERLPFENDDEVLGKWKLLDIVPSEEQFLYGHQKSHHRGWLEELYFLENGEKYWNLGGWTKGFLFTGGNRNFKHPYSIRNQDGHTLLFLKMQTYMDGSHKLSHLAIWVYEKVDSNIYHAADIRRRDFVDYPFILDEQVIGKWVVRDFYGYDFDSKFDPSTQNWNKDNLFVESITFNPDGSAERSQKNGVVKMEWTKGYTLEKRYEIASGYEIREVDGVEYLAVDWKSGDYVYGKEPRACKYIFVKE